MKTSELTGIALDWAVVKCECAIPAAFKSIPALLNGSVRVFRGDISSYSEPVSPSTDWALGGPIIEREKLTMWPDEEGGFFASADEGAGPDFHGESYLIAAMRCYVASKLGDEVEIPKGVK